MKKRSLSVGAVASADCTGAGTEAQSRVVRLLHRLQSRRERSDRRSIRGIFGLAILEVVVGLATLILETTTKLRHPNASAALLSMEAAGIFVGCFAVINGLVGIFTWHISKSGYKSCLVSFNKALCNFSTACSFGMFCLSLISLGIYTTLRDWQLKVSPFLHYEQKFVAKMGREDLSFPMHILEELVVLKATATSFHLIIFLTSLLTSIFCLFNIYISSLPNFSGCADVITSVGKTLTLRKSRNTLKHSQSRDTLLKHSRDDSLI